jgi:hypothetical protein
MLFAFLFLLFFFQNHNSASKHDAPDYDRAPDYSRVPEYGRETMFRRLEEQTYESPSEQARRQAAAFEEQQFVSRFNHLLRTLVEFSEHYNKDHSVNIKKIKAVKKAWHDLEKTDSWFKLEEGTAGKKGRNKFFRQETDKPPSE